MIALSVTYTVKDGQMAAVIAALDRIKPLIGAAEPDCLFYQVARSLSVPNTLHLYEVYRDQAAVDAHGQTPHFESIIKGEVIPLLESRVRNTLEVVIE